MPTRSPRIALLLLTTTLLSTTATGAVRWSGTRFEDGRIRFAVEDLHTGLEEELVLDASQLRQDRPIMVALDVDEETGRQGLSLVWTDDENVVHADRVDLDNVLSEEFPVEQARFVVDQEQVAPARVDETMTDAMARLEVTVEGIPGSLFSVLQTDRVQVDPEHGVPGDVDADGHVLVEDLLIILSNWADGCSESTDCLGDVDMDGTIGVMDLLMVLQNLGEAQADIDDAPARLIHFQLVGGSWTGDANKIHPLIYNDDDGWQALLNNNLADIAGQSPTGWDLWLHNPGGYWYDHDYTWRAPEGQTQPMVFEQLAFARDDRAGLLELDPIRDWMEARGGRMFGYVGMPRTFESATDDWTEMPEHGTPQHLDRFYGDLLQQGFRGIGHDASANHPTESLWVNAMVPELRSRGVEIFLESIPQRSRPHLLGQSVVAEHRHWQGFSENLPHMFYSEDEITAAGGRAIHLVMWPLGMSPQDSGYDPDFDLSQWQYDTTLALLEDGRTVAINLAGLVRDGFDVTPLIAAAQ